ncbi:MAG: hypothetical protein LN408_03260 [Candidatus Thermoplasmatota archaeon]|nr:hypothetical protein [Candidatus Thermoplasmatota archaeon]
MQTFFKGKVRRRLLVNSEGEYIDTLEMNYREIVSYCKKNNYYWENVRKQC